jgi:hypothetical protein
VNVLYFFILETDFRVGRHVDSLAADLNFKRFALFDRFGEPPQFFRRLFD